MLLLLFFQLRKIALCVAHWLWTNLICRGSGAISRIQIKREHKKMLKGLLSITWKLTLCWANLLFSNWNMCSGKLMNVDKWCLVKYCLPKPEREVSFSSSSSSFSCYIVTVIDMMIFQAVVMYLICFSFFFLFSIVARIALVKPEKARGVEDVILRAAQMGQIVEKVRIQSPFFVI